MKKAYKPTVFSELVRRLQLCGLVCTCILAAISFLIPLISALGTYNLSYEDSSLRPTATDLHTILAPIASWIAVLAGLALPYTAFSWLNKRRSSDFMHPLPIPAHQMFWWQMAAVFTWIAIIFLFSFVAFGLSCLLFGASAEGFWGLFILQTAKLIVSASLIASCAAAACAVTGTRLANLTVTAIFLFWPAFLYGGFALTFYHRAQLIPTSESTLLLPVVHNLSINLPGGLADLLFGFFGTYNYNSAAFGWTSVGVSLLYTAVWVTVGTWLYHRRLSESAGQASPTHLIQHLIRCALTSPVLLLPAFLLAAERTPLIEILDPESMAALVTLLAVTVIFYFAYEIISTRSFKRLLPSAAVFMVLPLAAVLIGTGTAAISDMILNHTPPREDLHTVYLIPERDQRGNRAEYWTLSLSRIPLQDRELLNHCHLALNVSVSRVLANQSLNQGVPLTLSFRYGHSSMSRVVYFDSFSDLYELLVKSESALEALRRTPSIGEIESVSINTSDFILDEEAKLAIWAIQQKQIQSFSASELYSYYFSNKYTASNPKLTLQGITTEGTAFYQQYPLTGEALIYYNDTSENLTSQYLLSLSEGLLNGELCWEGYVEINGKGFTLSYDTLYSKIDGKNEYRANAQSLAVARALFNQGKSLRRATGKSEPHLLLTVYHVARNGQTIYKDQDMIDQLLYLPQAELDQLLTALQEKKN